MIFECYSQWPDSRGCLECRCRARLSRVEACMIYSIVSLCCRYFRFCLNVDGTKGSNAKRKESRKRKFAHLQNDLTSIKDTATKPLSPPTQQKLKHKAFLYTPKDLTQPDGGHTLIEHIRADSSQHTTRHHRFICFVGSWTLWLCNEI